MLIDISKHCTDTSLHTPSPPHRADAALKPHQQRISERTSSRTSSRGWTAEEDAVLTEQYALYAGSHSVFTSIAQCPELR